MERKEPYIKLDGVEKNDSEILVTKDTESDFDKAFKAHERREIERKEKNEEERLKSFIVWCIVSIVGFFISIPIIIGAVNWFMRNHLFKGLPF